MINSEWEISVNSSEQPIGVLIMAYGGPNSLAELPGYLADIRQGRPTTPAVLEEIRHNYEKIGSKSPLLEMSRQQADLVAAQLGTSVFKTYLGMRHWAPWIEDVVGQMVADGIERAVSVVLAPHFSQMSVAKYQAKVNDGLQMVRGQIEFEHIASYHEAPKLIQAFADRVHSGLAAWPRDVRDAVHVVFSAHSLPERILKTGDPYDNQVRRTASLVAEAAGLSSDQWSWSYQSAGRSPEPWLGPQLQEYIPELAERGVKNIISIPVGFVSDHVEILYDIDIQAQAVAKACGVRLERPPALNNDPLFIDTLTALIQERASRWLSEKSFGAENA
jgi:ferrochelatase